MVENEQLPDDGVIRITRDEALSSHVDDFLRRQMSLRGEAGVQRDRRRWYYQNWFVLMVVGALAAFAAWAIIEPFFDDQFYIEGVVESVSTNVPSWRLVTEDNRPVDLSRMAHGTVLLNKNAIVLMDHARDLPSEGGSAPVKFDEIKAGQTLGMWVDTVETEDGIIGLSRYVVTKPTGTPPAKAKYSLTRLAARHNAAGMLLFPLVAGFIGLAIGAADGIICRLPRRAFLAGFVGLLVGLVGGFIFGLLAGIVYTPLNRLANAQMDFGQIRLTTFAFFIQMTGRALAWCFAGVAMGIGQGLALRSKRLVAYGLLGGVVGGLLGGLLFDPIDLLLLGVDQPSAHWSRMMGITVIGAAVGAMVGIVELLARDAWLRMTQGPLSGKEFLLFKDVMKIGSSPRSDIYLFNDPAVAAHHATLRAVGGECEIESRESSSLVLVNGRPVGTMRLRHGDQIGLGRTVFTYEKRQV